MRRWKFSGLIFAQYKSIKLLIINYYYLLCTVYLTTVSKWEFKLDAQRVCHACRKISDESLGGDETSFERLATKLSQVTVNFIVNIFTCEFVLSVILMRYKLGETAVIILLANGTFGATLNDFAKQKGLWWVPWPGRNELRETSHEIITSNCQLYC